MLEEDEEDVSLYLLRRKEMCIFCPPTQSKLHMKIFMDFQRRGQNPFYSRSQDKSLIIGLSLCL